MDIREAIIAVVGGKDLDQVQAAAVMDQIMGGAASPAQIAAFLTGLHLKGETAAEIAGMAAVMRARATPVIADGVVVDTCGTGGDALYDGAVPTFNISTTAAFIVAGAGVTVAKHGNRAMSSACGSADVLEGLGVNIELDAEGVARCLREARIGFMFAPKFHPAMRFAGPVRREIGIRTAFNVLGPLTNPARARHQVIGVASAALAEKLADALSRLDTIHALIVHGDDGMDELSLSGPSLVYTVRAGTPPNRQVIEPAALGLAPAPRSALRGGTIADNAAIVRNILAGREEGPRRDVALLNAAAALVAAEAVADFAAGLEMAQASIASGRAQASLETLIAVSNAS